MKTASKISLVMAGISIIGFAVTRIILSAWIPFLWVLLGMFVLFLFIPFLVDRELFKDFFTMKTTKHGMNMGAMILLVISTLAIVNFLASRHYATLDYSISKSNTLAEQSIKLVKSLDSDLKVLFFYRKGENGTEDTRKAFRDIIKKYQDYSAKIQLEFVELNERPDLAKEYGVDKGSGLAFFDYKGHRNRIEKLDEQELTSALVKVTREKNKTVYFIVGHGESNIEEEKDSMGLGAFKSMLENNRYTIKSHPLTTLPKIPEDADVVVIAGPKQEFSEMELAGLRDYLKKGGNLFVALKGKQNSGLDKILKEVGVELGDDYVFNVIEIPGIGKGVQQESTMGAQFSSTHQITKNFGKGEVVRFHFPQSVRKTATSVAGISIDEIVKTTNSSMSFKDLKSQQEATDQKEFAMMDAIKGKFPGADPKDGKEFSIVVVGDVDFMNNALLYQNLNRDLLLNTVAGLSREENLISIAPRDPEVTKMTYTNTKQALYLFGFFIPLPLLLFASSLTLWFRRRNA